MILPDISLVRILIGIVLTIILTPIVGLICLLRQVNKPTAGELDQCLSDGLELDQLTPFSTLN